MSDSDQNQNVYRAVCRDLNTVLLIKGMTLEEEKALYWVIKKRVKDAETPVNLEDYKKYLVKKFVVDMDSIMNYIATSDMYEEEEIYDIVYDQIINLYPNFSMTFICTELNSNTFMRGLEESTLFDRLKKTIEGEAEDPDINLSSLEDIKSAERSFKKNILGQDQAIASVIKALKLTATGLSQGTSFLFVGPTGVGKTELAKILGDKYSGNFYKVNCAEYAGGHEYAKLIGSPPGYVGHTEKSLMAEKAEKSNRWVFLFDEIEKAHHKLYDFLLSLLDDGTCTDNMGNVLDFSQSLFIFTSNKGIVESKQRRLGFTQNDPTEAEEKDAVKTSVKGHFSPEFMNRIDEVVVFNALTKKDVKKIAKLQLDKLPIEVTDPLLEYIVKHGYSREYGARNIARFIKNNISDKIADAILNGKVPKKEGALYSPKVTKDGVKIYDVKNFEADA
jgi:ATP-dependent Clp protease ATP-binding subunit ClpA